MSKALHARSQSGKRVDGDGKLVVIKVGTSSLIREDRGTLNLSNISRICETVKGLRSMGHSVVIVTSGAVGVGCQRLGLAKRPEGLAAKQALAAVGQPHLMRFYTDLFAALDITCAQVLLTAENLLNRSQYENARNTLVELLKFGTVPIVNENDTVAVKELRIGDNDTLSAQVASLLAADYVFLLTDVDALYTANPHSDPNAQRIPEVHDIGALIVDTSNAGTQWGTGGMATKLTAARIATAAGCHMVICHASMPENILKCMQGEQVGTIFYPLKHQLKGRKRWIVAIATKGEIWVDDGAVRAIKDKRKSLFAAGIIKVHGPFNAQDAVRILDKSGFEIARGLPSYDHEEVIKLKGKESAQFEDILGYHGPEEIIHRDNLAMVLDMFAEDGVGGEGGTGGKEVRDESREMSLSVA